MAGVPAAGRSVRMERVHAAAWTTELERQRPPLGPGRLERLSARADRLERFWPSAGFPGPQWFSAGARADWLEWSWPSAGGRRSERFRAGAGWLERLPARTGAWRPEWFRARAEVNRLERLRPGNPRLARLRPPGARRPKRVGAGRLE